ncbi:MAG TPA: cytochrome b/b6 domain-containing protein [Acidisphaera sp.]|nr:cytochrome b/b6 domain-containing protein [Acidisphaera sp.]
MATQTIRRHSVLVRLTHWINVLCFTLLVMSGMQIFNAHPALDVGSTSDFAHPLVDLGDGFPHWLTLPGYQDLALGRRWHFFLAWLFVLNGLAYLLVGLIGRHVRRDLVPTVAELRSLPHEIAEHARLRFPAGEAARRYNVLQQLTYLVVILVLLPLMLATGLTMSPGMDAAFPWLPELFGGRQTARTIHFASASLLVLFTVVHLAMVVLSGFFNNLRSMVTGRYVLPPERVSRERLTRERVS